MNHFPNDEEIRKSIDTLKQILDCDLVEDAFLYTERLAMANTIKALDSMLHYSSEEEK